MVALPRESEAESALEWRVDEEDRALAERAASDRESFGILYDRYVRRIYGFCYRRLQTHEAAEDATSQTFLRALTALSQGSNSSGSFKSWLFTIAYHVIVDAHRLQKPMALLDDVHDFAETDPGPEELALTGETGRELYALIDRLLRDQADLIHLRFSGLNDQEIAGVLGKSYGAVRIAQHRAMKRLRQMAAHSGTKGTPQ
jgi:RNA polymerase sigma-70 factor (ECF subfamily)